jgi:hypothetical protein
MRYKKSEVPLFFVFWFVYWELVNQNMLPVVIISKEDKQAANIQSKTQNPKSKIVRLMLH